MILVLHRIMGFYIKDAHENVINKFVGFSVCFFNTLTRNLLIICLLILLFLKLSLKMSELDDCILHLLFGRSHHFIHFYVKTLIEVFHSNCLDLDTVGQLIIKTLISHTVVTHATLDNLASRIRLMSVCFFRQRTTNLACLSVK